MTRAVDLRRHCLSGGEHPVCFAPPMSADRLRERALTLSGALARRPETDWGLWYENAADFLVAFFALALAGKRIVLPQNTRPGNAARLREQFDLLLTDCPDPSLELVQCSAADLGTEAPEDWQPELDAPVEIVLYTSGSTGEPQPIHKSLAMFEAELMLLEATPGLAPGATPVVATVSHQHIYGLLHRLLWPLWRGAPFAAERCQYPEELAQQVAPLEAALLVSSPTHLSRLAGARGFAAHWPRVADMISSGGPLAREDALALAECAGGRAPLEILGSTETGGVALRRRSDGELWQPLPGMALSLSEAGCLKVLGPHMGLFEPFVMGDRAKLCEDGRFELLGRADRVVKVEGKRLSLTEMERRLAEHPAVAEARLQLLQGRREEVGAVVVATDQGRERLEREGRLPLNRALRDHLAPWFEAPLLPRRWRYVEALPRNAQGKVTAEDLQALLQRKPH